ncbi:N-acetylneuraminate lyase [Tetragenococcus halophilus]|uniref:N-acetylneuraminate lyase n=1 Tax=Tetragenococcus halophilus TaxID=51669 RepID=UPI001EF1FBE1|nr:N-acetylneuraminate lyase [Tetragenococcus halophilus]MDN6140043.1 N-acetylneuraminate lyase [Tetragenococcus koreensis]MDN6630159.1 N-acetylneuraminate lyase [Staphylococcus equorum]MCF1675288.1 N-acetylneuraminate lyase [Tetragenococcus halophilus]MDN6146768.1 N-acetylneuraminate lyase [Tetragenococcus koreensis]MDN6166228.1 N-acetylneuraminate lyase [Tetragenococcus koreensis]
MTNSDLKGIYSALLSSINEDGSLNEAGLRQIIRHNIDKMKIDGLYVGGSSGENFLMDTDMKKKIFDIAKDEVGNQVKLIAQVGGTNVYESMDLAQYATNLGYDAISAVTPFYYQYSFEEIKEYYQMIVDSCDNRLLIYSVPSLTGVNINVGDFKELFKIKNIIGVKFTAPDFFLLERLRKACPDVLIFSGFDEMLLPAVVNGVDGAIGSTFNVNGKNARKIFDLAKSNKIEEARKTQHETNDLIEAILENGLYPTLKELLKLEGVNAGFNRRPMASADHSQVENAKTIYKNLLK